ncbi:FAD-dependent oxidoreductase [Streptomyces ficellus]|uniref:D-amino-acid oxidase n=1 Tax=Streptomyces ficellus TaxID=1977088 RepID=A0A6I6FGF5_9ACTN|nr:FAD-dependent oxidoreductase [Streptomyces ficellus]QGV77589.1 FAD-binding oxidoreductase [Streptomyces ficellus]
MGGDVIVVGGGVVGLTTAVTLAERGLRVRVWTRDAPGATTSSVAGALWWPYRIEPVERVGAWALASLEVYERLAAGPGATGVRMVAGVQAATELGALGPWAREVAALRQLPSGDLAAVLPLVDMPVHLAWLEARLVAAGGRVEVRTVSSLAEASAPVVVNCTGLGSRDLVPDPALRPVRGQLVLVENPGVEEWFVAPDASTGSATYFFPQPGRLVLGGTAEEDDWRTAPDAGTAAAIVARCARVRPEIGRARVLGHRVGLRPVRTGGVRLEAGPSAGGGLLVHNYGHGGAGVTVAWGCAREVARLVTAV